MAQRPLYVGSAILFVLGLELVALDVRALTHLGASLAPWQSAAVSDPRLLDTITAMTLNGALFYAAASTLTRYGSEQSAVAARLDLRRVCGGDHDPGPAAPAPELLLRRSAQSRGGSLLIAQYCDWFERPACAVSLIVAGLVALAAGFVMDRAARRRARL